MIIVKFCIQLASLVFITISFAHADIVRSISELQANQRIAAYFNSPAVANAIAQKALAKEKKFGLQPDCHQYDAKVLMIDPLAPIDFPAEQEHPIKGRWRTVIELNRCGQQRTYTSFFTASEKAGPTPRLLSAGVSLASDTLMVDAIGSVMLAMFIKNPEISKCKDIEFFNMAIIEQPTLPDPQSSSITSPWKESWALWFCGKVHSVGLRFEPNKDGIGTRFFVDAGLPGKSP